MSGSPASPSLADSATSVLRDEIVRGKMAPGTLLAEAAVAARLGVSRVPVREALFTLEREGLVEFSPTGRAFVRKLTPADFEELFALRLALEPLAAGLAAPFLSRDPSALERNVEATVRAQSVHEVTTLDLEFHELILAASGNGRVLKLWRSLRGELDLWLSRLHRRHQNRTRATLDQTVQAHRFLIHAFQTQPPAACVRLLRQHIQGWREWLPLSGEESVP
ncbi:MAG: transcriptional regulator, GntR family [Verrucomicrobiales bacterium]|nr:transcriptional regulator, GntR family [Verrucomicrobiales bacterium]